MRRVVAHGVSPQRSTLPYRLRQSIMKRYLPAGLSKSLTWEQALARSGFLFVIDNESFDFQFETPLNRLFLNELLVSLRLNPLDGHRLVTPSTTVDQERWVDAWQAWHPGEVAGASTLIQRQGDFELPGIDAFVAGISRWLTVYECPTIGSCDGHGKYRTQLNLRNHSQASEVATIVERCSAERIGFVKQYLLPTASQTREQFYCDLMDLAENMYLEVKGRIRLLPKRLYSEQEEEEEEDYDDRSQA